MPHLPTDRTHSNQAREKRDEELRDFDRPSLETVYKVSQRLSVDADVSGLPTEDMIAEIMYAEFGPLD
ncbi:MAG TPA: hypothetical protein VGN12_05850 [Pirellulales bacterium]